MGFGSQSFGSLAAGSGSARSLLSAEQVTRTTVRVVASAAVPMQNRGMVTDALYDRGWSLSAPSHPGAHVPRVVWAEREAARTVLLSLDAPLDGPGLTYKVQGSIAQFGPSLSARTARFRTFGEARAATAPNQSRSFDLANPQAGGNGPGEASLALGTLQLDADGDFATDQGVASLKKRIIRRLTTPVGSFRHLPDYGMRLALKSRATSGWMRDLQQQAIRQVRLELGVTDVQVAVSLAAPGVALLEVAVTANGVSFGVSVQVSGG